MVYNMHQCVLCIQSTLRTVDTGVPASDAVSVCPMCGTGSGDQQLFVIRPVDQQGQSITTTTADGAAAAARIQDCGEWSDGSAEHGVWGRTEIPL